MPRHPWRQPPRQQELLPSSIGAELMQSAGAMGTRGGGGVSGRHDAKPAVQPEQQALPGRSLTSRQDRMKFTASSGVKTLKRPSQASKMNLRHGEAAQMGFNSQLRRMAGSRGKTDLSHSLKATDFKSQFNFRETKVKTT